MKKNKGTAPPGRRLVGFFFIPSSSDGGGTETNLSCAILGPETAQLDRAPTPPLHWGGLLLLLRGHPCGCSWPLVKCRECLHGIPPPLFCFLSLPVE